LCGSGVYILAQSSRLEQHTEKIQKTFAVAEVLCVYLSIYLVCMLCRFISVVDHPLPERQSYVKTRKETVNQKENGLAQLHLSLLVQSWRLEVAGVL
jgi:hypothetical protein